MTDREERAAKTADLLIKDRGLTTAKVGAACLECNGYYRRVRLEERRDRWAKV